MLPKQEKQKIQNQILFLQIVHIIFEYIFVILPIKRINAHFYVYPHSFHTTKQILHNQCPLKIEGIYVTFIRWLVFVLPGIIILTAARGTVVFQLLFICSKSNSSPKKNMKNIRPKLAINLNTSKLFSGQIAFVHASIWPINERKMNESVCSFSLL